MYKGLINCLSYMYSFAARSRGKLTGDELHMLSSNAAIMTNKAPMLMCDITQDKPTTEDAKDYDEAVLMNNHIAQIVDLLIRQEIC